MIRIRIITLGGRNLKVKQNLKRQNFIEVNKENKEIYLSWHKDNSGHNMNKKNFKIRF